MFPYMTKEDSTALKGIAIQVMIFLHLFNNQDAPYYHMLSFGGYAVEYQLSRCADMCVSLYLFLSGYGLQITYNKTKSINVFRRIVSLYITLWIVVLVFIPIGLVVNPIWFDLSLKGILMNLTGWNPTWNGEWWFLFPYVLILFLCTPIFRILDRCTKTIFIALSLSILYLCVFACMKFNLDFFNKHRAIWLFSQTIMMLFPFVMGCLYAKNDYFRKWKKRIEAIPYRNTILMVIIITILVVRSQVGLFVIAPFFGILFLSLIAMIDRPKWLDAILVPLGRQSTFMWLIHTFFCYYIFREFIYAFKYSPVIFLCFNNN